VLLCGIFETCRACFFQVKHHKCNRDARFMIKEVCKDVNCSSSLSHVGTRLKVLKIGVVLG
jgi:hypothetical protein